MQVHRNSVGIPIFHLLTQRKLPFTTVTHLQHNPTPRESEVKPTLHLLRRRSLRKFTLIHAPMVSESEEQDKRQILGSHNQILYHCSDLSWSVEALRDYISDVIPVPPNLHSRLLMCRDRIVANKQTIPLLFWPVVSYYPHLLPLVGQRVVRERPRTPRHGRISPSTRSSLGSRCERILQALRQPLRGTPPWQRSTIQLGL